MQPSVSTANFDDIVKRGGNRTSQLIVVKTPVAQKNQLKSSHTVRAISQIKFTWKTNKAPLDGTLNNSPEIPAYFMNNISKAEYEVNYNEQQKNHETLIPNSPKNTNT